MRNPALFYGLSFLLGVGARLAPSWIFAIPSLALWSPVVFCNFSKNNLKRFSLALLTFSTAWSTAALDDRTPHLPENGIKGRARLNIQSIKRTGSFFGDRWVYRCRVLQFEPLTGGDRSLYSLPCTVTFAAGSDSASSRPRADRDYWVEGKLSRTQQGTFLLKVSKRSQWSPIENSSSWAESRFQWKQKVKRWIESKFSHSQSGSFLAGLATGEFDDAWMKDQFARFGLQHLLAISGFHFAIFTAFLSFILRLILPSRLSIPALLLLILLYCFFLGPQPSILRAWIMCSLALAAMFFERQAAALNSLGFAILILLAYEPFMLKELGFQFSFAATAAILLFYQPFQEWILIVLPKKSLVDAIEMDALNQHGLLVLAFLRESLALGLAVNVFALPLTLFYFHQFPWMSLLYNLFFPLLATVSLCLLFFGLLLTFAPPLAAAIHYLNDYLTYFLLQLAYQSPQENDAYFIMESLSLPWLIFFLTITAVGGILWKETKGEAKDSFGLI